LTQKKLSGAEEEGSKRKSVHGRVRKSDKDDCISSKGGKERLTKINTKPEAMTEDRGGR